MPTDESGLLYMRSRYYSPDLRQFLSADSYMGDLYHPASLNPYSYVEGNPVRYIDPMGYAASMPEEAEAYVTMREYHERLYEAMYQGQVHSEHFLKKPIQERLSLAYQAFQRDGLRAALYETSDFMEKAVARWDNFMEWGYSTEPMGRKRTRTTSEIILAVLPGLSTIANRIEERIQSITPETIKIPKRIGDDITLITLYSAAGTLLSSNENWSAIGRSRLYHGISKTASMALAPMLVIPDIVNTWTEDSGNTNFKRIGKTAIQAGGAYISYRVGKETSKILQSGSKYAIASKGVSMIIAIEVVTIINTTASYMIQKGQESLYELFEIQ